MLWSLVVDELLTILQQSGFEVFGYADDIAVMVRGWHLPTISERLQSGLNAVDRWCREQGLCVNPLKTEIIPFTRRRKLESLGEVSIGATVIL